MDGVDIDEKLVFREVKGTSLTTLTSNSKVVDINVDQEALDKLNAGNLKDTTHILSICWDSDEYQQCSSICEINFPKRRDASVITVLSRLIDQRYCRLQSLIETIYQRFKTRVIYIHHNPLTFGLLHGNMDGFKHFKANIIPLESLFISLYKDFTKARLQIKLINNESDSNLAIADTDIGPKKVVIKSEDDTLHKQETFSVSRDRLEATVQRADFQKASDDETVRRLQEIERHLQTQGDTMNTTLQQHQKQYQKMNESLQMLLKLVQEKKSNVASPLNHQSSIKSTPNSDISSISSNGIGPSSSPVCGTTSDGGDNSSEKVHLKEDTMSNVGRTMSSTSSDQSSLKDSTQSSSSSDQSSLKDSTQSSPSSGQSSLKDSTQSSSSRDRSSPKDSTKSPSSSGQSSPKDSTHSSPSSDQSSLKDSTQSSSSSGQSSPKDSTQSSSSSRSAERKHFAPVNETLPMSKSSDSSFNSVSARTVTSSSTRGSYSSNETLMSSPDETTYSNRDMSSTDSTLSRSDSTAPPSSKSRALTLSDKKLHGKPTVTSEGDNQTGAAFQPDEKQEDTRVPLMDERVSDVTPSQSGNTLQREGPSNILIVENTKSAQSHVSAVEPRVAPPHSAGRQVGISKSSFDEDQHTVPSSVSFEKGDESIQDVLSAVDESRIDDVKMPPKGNGLDTVLCLDTSQSMREEGLREVKQIALDFLNGIDDIACDHGTEENIAVIKLGGRPRIVHHLSNDYTSVRGAIEKLELGGQTPLLECLQVGLCSVQGGRGCIINISGCHLLSPRVIVITDGKASEGYGGSSDVEDVQQNVKMHVVKVISEFKARKNNPEFPKPFVWIPAGRADKTFLKSLSNLSGGVYMAGENVNKLCTYQQIQDSVIKGVQDKLDGKDGCGNVNAAKPDFNNDVEYETLPPLGTRVVRGPHWKHRNQDSEGPGTVYQHCESQGPNQGIILVHWDNGMTERYSYGLNESYEVCTVTDQPRCPIDEEIEIGCEVTRGPDWTLEYSEQDGGPGCVGVVIRKDDDCGVKVRWRETCFIGIYRYKKGGPRDVILRDPVDILKEITKGGSREKETEEVTKVTEDKILLDDVAGSATKVWTWKWVDEGNNWYEYSQEIVQKLEKAYTSHRSCLIKKNQHSYRVLFKDMIEKCIDTNTRRRVERTPVDDTYR